MTDAPKKIWASIRAEYASGLSGEWATDQSTVYPELEIPYIRQDFAQARIAELEAALQKIADSDDMYEPAGWAIYAARAALKV
jgi:hypothetical protein